MVKLSIIIPAHNEEKYLPATVESIFRQSWKDYEVIIVVNGCTDKTEEIAKSLKKENITVLSLPKANVSRARNHGAAKAAGSILLFLDADTQLTEQALQRIQEQFTVEYAVATTKVKPDSLEAKYKLAMLFKSLYLSSALYKGCSGALICRREQFDAVNGYDSDIAVKEQRRLTKKLLPYGKYTCINAYVITSMRRLEQWGLFRTTVFWGKQWLKDTFSSLEGSEYEKIR